MKRQKIQAPCAILIMLANVVVFLALTMQGMTENGGFLLEHGAMYLPYVIEEQQYYRVFTSMFLHFGFEHLMNNMVMLMVIGWNLEMEIGTIRFLIIYLLSGLGGNLMSACWSLKIGEYAISAGASGAIFGLIGALFYVALRNRGRIGNITGQGIIVLIVLSLYFGYASSGVDNMAHIGGLVSGFFLGVLLYWKCDRKDGSMRV